MSTDDTSDLDAVIDLLWSPAPAAARPPSVGLTDIASAGIAIADAVTSPRVGRAERVDGQGGRQSVRVKDRTGFRAAHDRVGDAPSGEPWIRLTPSLGRNVIGRRPRVGLVRMDARCFDAVDEHGADAEEGLEGVRERDDLAPRCPARRAGMAGTKLSLMRSARNRTRSADRAGGATRENRAAATASRARTSRFGQPRSAA